MSQNLPVLKTPSYTLTIPSSKKKIKYRPFLVREEKILLLVKESQDANEMMNAMKDVVNACTFNAIDVETLSVFDLEYMFLQLRSKAVGEKIELMMTCVNPVAVESSEETIDCGNKIPFEIDISKVEVVFPENHTNVIMLEDNVGITFKYPSFETILELDNGKDEFAIIVSLIENIFDAENVYDAKDSTTQQLSDFIDSIPGKQYEKIMNDFFRNMPILEYTHKYKCGKCGQEGSYTFRGISDFF